MNPPVIRPVRFVVALALALVPVFALEQSTVAARAVPMAGDDPIFGTTTRCDDFVLQLIDLGYFGSIDVDISDEGWTWVVGQHDRFRSLHGVVTNSHVTNKDTPSNHDSHDHNTDVRLDAGQVHLLSTVNHDEDEDGTPDTIEIEWEIGARPSEKQGDGAHPIFPKWAWPSIGDRFWVDGHWAFDCGHATEDIIGWDTSVVPPIPIIQRRYRTEIHPARAVASMRQQVHTVPGSGTTPVPVTATDVYIHGRSGFVVDILTCGMGIILGSHPDTCGTSSPPPEETYHATPIDANFEFDVCVPPRPSLQAVLKTTVENDPNVDPAQAILVEPDIDEVAANDDCKTGDQFDHTSMLHVTVPLAGTGVSPDQIYARHLYSGWVFPPSTPLRHFSVTLNKMDLHNDHDPLTDGELSFFWMNVNRATDEWARIVDFQIPTDDDSGELCPDHTNTMNDYDDDDLCGNGELRFSGPTWDFYLRPGQDFTIRAHGYDQDCYDGHYGDHHFGVGMYIGCAVDLFEGGNNDNLVSLPSSLAPDGTTFGPASTPPYGVGSLDLHATHLVAIPNSDPIIVSEYELEMTVAELPAASESADLQVMKKCTFAGEVALTGQPLTCTVDVDNNGPALPREVVLTDTLTTDATAGSYVIGTPTFTFSGPVGGVPGSCTVTPPNQVRCELGTVPVGGRATITMTITPSAPGTFTNAAHITSASSDPVPTNNDAQDAVVVFQLVNIDVLPGGPTNTVNLGSNSLLPVAALSSPTFDASTINPAAVCFGDAEAPSERDCTLANNRPNLVDVNGDHVKDLLLQFEVRQTGIDAGDTQACLKGFTFAGKGFYGCDAIVAK